MRRLVALGIMRCGWEAIGFQGMGVRPGDIVVQEHMGQTV